MPAIAEESPSELESGISNEEKKSDPSSSESEGSNTEGSLDVSSSSYPSASDNSGDSDSEKADGVDEKEEDPTPPLTPKIVK